MDIKVMFFLYNTLTASLVIFIIINFGVPLLLIPLSVSVWDQVVFLLVLLVYLLNTKHKHVVYPHTVLYCGSMNVCMTNFLVSCTIKYIFYCHCVVVWEW